MGNKISFNKELYSIKSIKEGIIQFSEYFDSTLNENDKYYIISVILKDNVKENIIDDFKNYILFYTINNLSKFNDKRIRN